MLLGIALLSLVLSAVLERFVGTAFLIEPEAVRIHLEGYGVAAPLVFVAAIVAAIVIAPIPSIPLDIAGGLAFGWMWGAALTLAGDGIGALVAFTLARRLGRDRLRRRLSTDRTAYLDALEVALTPRTLLVMRLLPVFSFEWLSYAAGLTSMSGRRFLAVTMVGTLVPVVLLVGVGGLIATDPSAALAIFALLASSAIIPLAWWSLPARHSPQRVEDESRDRAPAGAHATRTSEGNSR
ncbi:MAG: TVP38/TMEM64 family protein [Dehalococcoidia bacterium]